MGEVLVIRHAPARIPGRLNGRTDAEARIDAGAITRARRVAEAAGPIGRVITSPARRCVQTARALWPDMPHGEDARLWEQDFGAHDGLAFADLPDLGVLSNAELAAYAPPEGESFADLCARVGPAMDAHAVAAAQAGMRIALVAHAGTVRAALGHVLGDPPAGLSFEVETLSVTRIRAGATGAVSVMGTGL